MKEAETAARAMGLQIQVLNASTSSEIDAAFATLVRERPDALLVGPDPFSSAGASNLPTGGAPCDTRDLFGARLRRGWRADELRNQCLRTPIVRSASTPAASSRARSRRTCRSCSRPSSSWSSTSRPPRMLGLEVPPTLLARADEVIE